MTLRSVYAGGSWDLLHVGHLSFLDVAADYGDVLIVGVMNDAAVLRYKGHRPIIPYKDRVRMLEALRFVDKVVCHYLEDREPTESELVNGWRQPCEARSALVPWCPPLRGYVDTFDIGAFIHGNDSRPAEYSGYNVPLVQVKYCSRESTTAIIRRIRACA